MQHRLNLCMKTGQQVHPRTIITFVQEVLNGTTQYYRTVGNIWDSLYLIELRLHEEQDKIAQIVAALSSILCMRNTSMPAKGKCLPKEKASRVMVKVPNPGRDQHATIIGSQAVAHTAIIVRCIIQGDSQADVQSVVPPSMSLRSVLVQSSLKSRMPSGRIPLGRMKKKNGMTVNGSLKSMKRPRVRKAKGKVLSQKASQRVRKP